MLHPYREYLLKRAVTRRATIIKMNVIAIRVSAEPQARSIAPT
jgi:hypothetical protein